MGCGIAIVKYLVFVFNLVFALIGLALLVVGVLFKLDIQGLTNTFKESFGIAPTLLIVVGAFIFIISFFGCCGAIKESHCMLITYGVLLLLILLLQIAIGIYLFMTIKESVNIQKDITNEMQEAFNKYNTSTVDHNHFDRIQKALKCCGVEGPKDWNNKIPLSCCMDTEGSCTIQDATLYHDGCADKGYQKIMMVVKSVGYVVFGICIAELIGIFFAFCLTSSIKNQYRRGAYA